MQSPLVMDVHILHQMVDPLLSYHTFWLRAALVAVLRGDLMRHDDSRHHGSSLQDAARKGVAVLLREGLLYERDIHAALDKQAAWVRSSVCFRKFSLRK